MRGRQPGPRRQRGRSEEARRAGHDVRLTVDLPIQHVAEESLTQGMDGARTLVDNQTGQLLPRRTRVRSSCSTRAPASVVAMASNPSFNPNDFISGNSDQYFKDPDNPPLLNRALNAYRAGIDVQADHVPGDVAEPACIPTAPNTTYSPTIPTGASTSATTRSACNAGERGARGGRPAVGVDRVQRRVLLHGWERVLEGVPQRRSGRRSHRRPRRRQASPTRSTPSGTRSSTPPACTASVSRPGSDSATRPVSIPDHEYRVKLNPEQRGPPDLAPR